MFIENSRNSKYSDLGQVPEKKYSGLFKSKNKRLVYF